MNNLSPAARATYDAFNRVGLYSEPTFETDRKALAAAIRTACDELSYGHGSSAGTSAIINEDELLAIADELEGIKYGTYRCPVPE